MLLVSLLAAATAATADPIEPPAEERRAEAIRMIRVGLVAIPVSAGLMGAGLLGLLLASETVCIVTYPPDPPADSCGPLERVPAITATTIGAAGLVGGPALASAGFRRAREARADLDAEARLELTVTPVVTPGGPGIVVAGKF